MTHSLVIKNFDWLITGNSYPDPGKSMLKRIGAPVFSLLGGLLLSACAATLYVPNIRDVTEEPISGDYWYQRFTLYTPADSARNCQISRTGTRIDLSSPAALADTWRRFCRSSSDHDSGGSSN